jgi:hypothetical protein
MATTVSAAQRSTKLDPAKLRLFSIPRKAVPGGATTSGGTTPLGAPSASRGNSADPRISRTNTATSQLGTAASRVASRDAYSREGSRASALTKRSLSSEDARRIMKDRMSRPPDIAPVRGGNINIDNVTPEYVTEFWTRKKMESDEFKRRRLELNSAKKHALSSAQVVNGAAHKEGGDAAASSTNAEGKGATTVTRQPLRVARPATLKPGGTTASTAAAAGKTDIVKGKVAPKPTTGASPTRTTSPPQAATAAAAKRPIVRTSSAGGIPRATPLQSGGKGLVRSASATSPAPSQPVARRLLVGTALGKRSVSPPQPQVQDAQPPVAAEPAQLQAAVRTPSSTSLPKRPTTATTRPSTAATTRPSTASSPPKGILASGKGPSSRGPSPAGTQRRVHIDPTVAEGKKDAAEVEGLEAVF